MFFSSGLCNFRNEETSPESQETDSGSTRLSMSETFVSSSDGPKTLLSISLNDSSMSDQDVHGAGQRFICKPGMLEKHFCEIFSVKLRQVQMCFSWPPVTLVQYW